MKTILLGVLVVILLYIVAVVVVEPLARDGTTTGNSGTIPVPSHTPRPHGPPRPQAKSPSPSATTVARMDERNVVADVVSEQYCTRCGGRWNVYPVNEVPRTCPWRSGVYHDLRDGGTYLVGSATNPTDHPYSYVAVVFEITGMRAVAPYDSFNMGTRTVSTSYLGPGSTWEFRQRLPGEAYLAKPVRVTTRR